MKFITLFRNELRTAAPWILLAIAVMVFVGGFVIYVEYMNRQVYPVPWHNEPGIEIRIGQLLHRSPLSGLGPWLFCSSMALGLVLGAVHFWMPFVTKTWAFTLHRSVSRLSIVSAKMTAAAVAFLISLGLIWTIFFCYVYFYQMFSVPPELGVYIEGWLFILYGMLVYLATGVAAISTARWYTTKVFALGFVFLVILLAFLTGDLFWAILTIAIGAAIFKVQLFYDFSTREF
jgi:ABC-type transport system involved in multi-copper enzyme maturation permease subunit